MLSLIEGTKIRVLVPSGRTELREVQTLGPTAFCYDTFGRPFPISIVKAEKEEKRVFVMASHGEAAVFGETHQIFSRAFGEAEWKRRPLIETNADVFVMLPQKKIYRPDALFDALDYDDEGMFYTAETVKDLLQLMEMTSTLGVVVNRHRTEKRIDISQKRPLCFANKLINGNFDHDAETALSNLAANGVIQPWKMYGREFVGQTIHTGIIFEGNCVYNDLNLLPPKTFDRPIPVWHVKPCLLEDEHKPVELTWFMS